MIAWEISGVMKSVIMIPWGRFFAVLRYVVSFLLMGVESFVIEIAKLVSRYPEVKFRRSFLEGLILKVFSIARHF